MKNSNLAVSPEVGECQLPAELVEDMHSVLTILGRLRFTVGPEFLRQDVVKAIKHIKHGLALVTTDD